MGHHSKRKMRSNFRYGGKTNLSKRKDEKKPVRKIVGISVAGGKKCIEGVRVETVEIKIGSRYREKCSVEGRCLTGVKHERITVRVGLFLWQAWF